LSGHTGGIFSLDMKGQILASGSKDTSIRVWDLQTNKCLWKLQGHFEGVKRVQLKDRSRLIVSSSDDKTIRLWVSSSPYEPYEHVNTFRHTEKICGMKCNNQRIASGGYDKFLSLWDLNTGKLSRKLPNSGVATSIEMKHNTIMNSARDGKLRVWDLRNSNPLAMTIAAHNKPALCLKFSEFTIISGGEDQKLYFFDIRTASRPLGSITTSSPVACFWAAEFPAMVLVGTWGVPGLSAYFDPLRRSKIQQMRIAGHVESIVVGGSRVAIGALDPDIQLMNVCAFSRCYNSTSERLGY